MARLQSAKHKPRQPDHPSPAYLLKSSNAIRQQRLSTEAITKTAVAAIDTDTDAGGAQPNHPRQRTGGQGQQSRRPTNWPRLIVAKAYQKFEDGTTFAPLPDDATDEDRRKRKRALEQKRDVVQAALHAGAETLPESARDAQKRLAWLRGQIYAEDALLKKEPIDSCHPCKRQRIELKRQSKTAVAVSAARKYPPPVREERRAKQSQASEAGAPGAPRSNRDTRSRYGNSNGSPPTGHPPTWQQPTGAIDLFTLLSPKTRYGKVPCEEQILTQDDARLRRAIDDQVTMASKEHTRDQQSDIEASAEQQSASGELNDVAILVEDSESGTDGDLAEPTDWRWALLGRRQSQHQMVREWGGEMLTPEAPQSSEAPQSQPTPEAPESGSGETFDGVYGLLSESDLNTAVAASPVQPSSPSDDTEQARCEAFMLRHDDKMREMEHEPDSTLYFAEVDLASHWVRFRGRRNRNRGTGIGGND